MQAILLTKKLEKEKKSLAKAPPELFPIWSHYRNKLDISLSTIPIVKKGWWIHHAVRIFFFSVRYGEAVQI